jgi:hypothetical protein
MTGGTYEYREPGRRPLTMLAFGFSIFMVWMAVQHDAPVIIFFIVVPCCAALLWMVVANPVSGLRLDSRTLTLSPWRKPEIIPLDSLERLEYTDWSEGSSLDVVLVSGEKIRVFSGDIPPIDELRAACKAHDVTLIEK